MGFIIFSFFIAFTNPCFQKSVPFIRITHEGVNSIILDARRVVDIQEGYFTYNLGTEEIIIYPEGFRANRFIKYVHQGRCGYKENVILKPFRKSPFNRKFSAH